MNVRCHLCGREMRGEEWDEMYFWCVGVFTYFFTSRSSGVTSYSCSVFHFLCDAIHVNVPPLCLLLGCRLSSRSRIVNTVCDAQRDVRCTIKWWDHATSSDYEGRRIEKGVAREGKGREGREESGRVDTSAIASRILFLNIKILLTILASAYCVLDVHL